MDKYKIKIVLRLLLANNITIEKSTQEILETFKFSKRFNWHNFFIGFMLGGLVGILILYYLVN